MLLLGKNMKFEHLWNIYIAPSVTPKSRGVSLRNTPVWFPGICSYLRTK